MSTALIKFNVATPDSGKKRKPNWNDDEVKVLLRIWKDYRSRLQSATRNQLLYEDMSKQMELYDVFRDPADVRCKIKNMTKIYKLEKSQEYVNGVPSKWRFYSKIAEILGEDENVGYVKDSNVKNEERPFKRLKAESGQATILRLNWKQQNNESESCDEVNLEPDESHSYNEASFNSNTEESNWEKKEAEENFMEELYQEYKETKQSLMDTDQKILELLTNQNELIKTQNDLCKTQNAILTSLLKKMD